jgi:hypothetical protein
MGQGYWTRANPETCWLATRGKPQRLHTDVRQLIVAPIREHSRKPDEIHDRIERLVAGPYLELYARRERPGWLTWGDELPFKAPSSSGDVRVAAVAPPPGAVHHFACATRCDDDDPLAIPAFLRRAPIMGSVPIITIPESKNEGSGQ